MKLIACVLSLVVIAPMHAAEKPLVVDVWPGKVPGEDKPIGKENVREQKVGQRTIQLLTDVSKPTLTVFRPAKDKDTGAAVVICPGGGYHILAWDLEGEEVATWLNSIGVTAIILKYRVPHRPGQPGDKPPPGPLQDAQRALSLVRGKAAEWKIDSKRIGILGFSAGGHLSASASTNFDKRAYEAIDDIDKISCRPDFAVLVYPAYLLTKDGKELAPDIRVRKDCPPTFFAHANDDPIKPGNSARMYLALKQAGVPAELHIYSSGGHGFGLRTSDKPCSTWPARCAEWLRAQGILKIEKAAEAPRKPAEKQSKLLQENERRITVAKSECDLWQERSSWSGRMAQRGFVPAAQAEADQARRDAAVLQLEKLVQQRQQMIQDPSKAAELLPFAPRKR